MIVQPAQAEFALFPKTAQELEANFQAVQSLVTGRIGQIASIKERTFENTVLAYDRTLAYFRIHGSAIATLKMVHPDDNIRKAAEGLLADWWKLQIDLFETNKEMYRAFREFETKKEGLNPEREYYLTNAVKAFQRAGLDLNPQEYERLKDLQKQIALLSIQFQTNISSSLDYPTYYEVMHNCPDEETRRDFYHRFHNRGYPQNLEVLTKIINCRDDLAKLLGYNSFAEYDIAPEMARTVERVEAFLDRLSEEAHPKIKSAWEGLSQINGWDAAYLHKQIDENQIAEYFPLEETLQGLFHVYEQFFDLKFQLRKGEYWDPSVQVIEVFRHQSLAGEVLLDLFPRENKYSHCCCNCIIPPMSFDQGQTYAPALAVVIANFSKSAHLMHHEVKTFFHEFGHALHALFGKAEMPTKAAYNTTMDFIETPSQLLEEWMWDRDILKRISCHYQTKEPLPDALIDSLIASRGKKDAAHPATGGDSDHTGTEIHYARLSLNLFKAGKDKDLESIVKEVFESTPQIIAYDAENHYLCAFGHLTSYGAKYYSYPWSKQLALKIFNYIKSHGGLLDPHMGERYLSKIIGRGGSSDPNELLEDFL